MKKIFASLTLFATVTIPGFFALADTCDSTKEFCNPTKYSDLNEFVSAVIETAVQVLLPVVVLAFIYSGFLFVKAQGKPKEIEAAQKAILWSFVGALILFGAWGFAQMLETTLETFTS